MQFNKQCFLLDSIKKCNLLDIFLLRLVLLEKKMTNEFFYYFADTTNECKNHAIHISKEEWIAYRNFKMKTPYNQSLCTWFCLFVNCHRWFKTVIVIEFVFRERIRKLIRKNRNNTEQCQNERKTKHFYLVSLAECI